MKIALGTTSKDKRVFLDEVLNELQSPFEIEQVDVKSGVSDQPVSSSETKKGSINRAKNALEESKSSDFGLGIEVGYHSDKNGDYEMFCWASIVDRKGKIFSAQSHKLKLPGFHQKVLKENKYLGEYVRLFLKENQDPVSQHIGIIIRDRKPFIQTAIKSALIYYLQH